MSGTLTKVSVTLTQTNKLILRYIDKCILFAYICILVYVFKLITENQKQKQYISYLDGFGLKQHSSVSRFKYLPLCKHFVNHASDWCYDMNVCTCVGFCHGNLCTRGITIRNLIYYTYLTFTYLTVTQLFSYYYR